MLNEHDIFALDIADEYKLKRLVMVNSARAHYVELMIDKTAAIVASNNEGKTSTFNTLKLFLLPEENFNRCASKFGFLSSQGDYYTTEQSFSFYFPSDKSFIILEASNPKGDFCIVLHRRADMEFGYGRLAVAESYDNLRHLFWESSVEENRGLGCQPSDLSLASISSQLKRDFKARELKKKDEIKDSLYTRFDESKPETRFCIMPLVQRPSNQLMESIKSLLELSSTMSKSDNAALPKAVAHVIDGRLAVTKEPVAVDFREINAEKESLKRELEHVTKLRNNEHHWSSLEDNYSNYNDAKSSLAQVVNQVRYTVLKENERVTPLLSALAAAMKAEKEQRIEVRARINELSELIDNAKGEIKTETNYIENWSKTVEFGEKVFARERMSVGDDRQLIINHLGDFKKEIEEAIKSLEDAEEAQRQHKASSKKQEDLESQIDLKRRIIERDSRYLLANLPNHAASVLNSLSPQFRELCATPTPQQTQIIKDFASLFASDDFSTTFIGERLPHIQLQQFDAEENIKNATRDKANLEKALAKEIENQKKIEERMAAHQEGNSEELAKAIAEQRKELEEIEKEIKALEDSPTLKNSIKEATERKSAAEKRKAEAENERSLKENERDELRTRQEAREAEQIALRGVNDSLINATRKLSSIRPLVSEITDYIDKHQTELEIIDLSGIAEKLAELDRLTNNFITRRDDAKSDFSSLMAANIIRLDVDTAPLHRKEALELPEFEIAYELLRSEFVNIEDKELTAQTNIVNHNHRTNSELSKLDIMSSAIKNFEDEINKSLAKTQISNLGRVSIKIETDEGFNTLQKEQKSHNNTNTGQTEVLMEESFYTRLMEFSEGFTDERTGRLGLVKIIKRVNFIYHLNGEEVTTAQSNGTTGMANAVLLTLLIKDLVPDDVQFSMPIVFDEIGSLDASNLTELRRTVELHKLTLFVAHPTLNALLATRINTIFMLGLKLADKVNKGLEERRTIFISGHPEFDRTEFEVIDESLEIEQGLGGVYGG